MYKPRHLGRWTMPSHYFGATWPNHYSSGVGQSRDSDAIERSNFATMLKDLGGESEVVTVVRESHWAVGWVEWIAIEADGTPESDKALQTADKNKGRLADYPVLDEGHWSELEWTEAADYWESLSPRERVRMALETRKRYHWLQNEPVWPLGRLDYYGLSNHGSTISEALCESLRN
jgi:hypothetical protein